MTIELTVLTLAALLAVVQFVLYAVPANRELGTGYTMSARDRDPTKPMSDHTGRLQRAFNNHMEWLMFFGLAVGVIQMSGQNTWFTALCAWTYLIARILYVPAYVLGWRPGRSVVWMFGFCPTVLMLLAALI